MSDTPIDKLAVMRAEIDQMIANSPDLARAYHAVFVSFCNAGFTEPQAMTLLIAQIHSWTSSAAGAGDG